jgi:hypothetical protein
MSGERYRLTWASSVHNSCKKRILAFLSLVYVCQAFKKVFSEYKKRVLLHHCSQYFISFVFFYVHTIWFVSLSIIYMYKYISFSSVLYNWLDFILVIYRKWYVQSLYTLHSFSNDNFTIHTFSRSFFIWLPALIL